MGMADAPFAERRATLRSQHISNPRRLHLNCYGSKEFAQSFRTVRKNTLVIAEEIPEDKYSFRAAPEVRSVGQLLSHIALSYSFQYQIQAVEKRTTLVGFDFPALMQRLIAEEKSPRSKAQTIELLRTTGEKWATFLDGVSDEFLAEQVGLPPGATPPSRSRFEMLLSVKEHEMHHRGQLMLIERMLNIVPHLTREMQARFAAAAQRS
jgi:uncharacterized damage-inducible protein DinB